MKNESAVLYNMTKEIFNKSNIALHMDLTLLR